MDILSHRCCVCVDTKRDHGGQENNSRLCGLWGKIWRALGTEKNTKVTLRYGTGVALSLSAAQVDIQSHRCCVCVDTKRDHGGQENNSRLCGLWGKIWRALGTEKNTKVTLRYGTGVALSLSAAQVDILSHRCCVCVDTKRDHGGQENNSRLCGTLRQKFGELWAPRKIQKSHFRRKKVCACWRFESWLGLYRIDLSCPFCVAGVARSIITPF